MRLQADGSASLLKAFHHPAIATAAVITIAADADHRWVLETLSWSYDALPTGGLLTISVGGSVKYKEFITNKGPGFFPVCGWNEDGAKNEALVVTLAAAGGAVTGTLNVTYR